MRIAVAVAFLALLACSDALAPVTIGAPYRLQTVNGHPLPWSTPPSDSQYIPLTITDGSVTFLDDSKAQRQENAGRWVLTPSGDSIVAGVRLDANRFLQARRVVDRADVSRLHARRDRSVASGGNTVRGARWWADAAGDRPRLATRQHYPGVLHDAELLSAQR